MRAPDKQRILDAVHHIERPDIPILEIDPDMELVNRILGKELPLSIHPFDMEAEDNLELNLRMGNDLVYFSHVWRLGRKEMTDTNGRIHYVDGIMKTRDSLRSIRYPDMITLERRLESLCRAVESTNMGIMCGAQTAAFTSMSAIGYQDYLLYTITDPEFILDFTKIIQDYCLKEMEMMMKYPVDIMKLGSGLVNNSGPMISYEMLEQFETSFIRDQVRMIKEKNLPVYFHIDGNLKNLIQGYIDMGIDILDPIDPCSGTQDIFEIKQKYGHQVALSGNIDINGVLKNGTPEEVQADVREHIDRLAVGGGYIVSSSHNLHELIPLHNYIAMRDAVHNYSFHG